MYGFVHEAVVDYLLSFDNSDELIKQVLEEAGCPDHSPTFHTKYTDELSLAIVGAVCKVLDKPLDEVLFSVGQIQLKGLFDKGYGNLVRALGADFCEMVENLDGFHLGMASNYPEMRGPSFKLHRIDDHTAIIRYHSPRDGLAPYAQGLLSAIADQVFETDLTFDHQQKKGVNGADHDIFHVKMEFRNRSMAPSHRGSAHSISSMASSAFSASASTDLNIPSRHLGDPTQAISSDAIDHLFPWHITVDDNMRITSVGFKLALHLAEERKAAKEGGQRRHRSSKRGKGAKSKAREQKRIFRAKRALLGRHFLDIACLVSPRLEVYDMHALGLLKNKSVTVAIKNNSYASMMATEGAETKCATVVSNDAEEDDSSDDDEDTNVAASARDSTPAIPHNDFQQPSGDDQKPQSVAVPRQHGESKLRASVTLDRCPFSSQGSNTTSITTRLQQTSKASQDLASRLSLDSQPSVIIEEDEEGAASQVATASDPNLQDGQVAESQRSSESRASACLARRNSFNIHDPKKVAELLCLKGELVSLSRTPMGQSATITFVGVPHVNKFSTLKEKGLGLDDIPLHTNAREIIISAEAQSATQEQTEKLNVVTEKLNAAMKEAEQAKEKANQLLHSILPKTVAESLSSGKPVKAEKYIGVSILFSDIVGFTRISSLVSPAKVMRMLNTLFSKLDALCEKHNVYKVETIGDAYLVAAGAPERCHDHARRIAAFALDMVKTSRAVASPVDGKPLQIRIGIHTGSITAGIVGTTRPRYCLFGDSVNTASRMESTSLPGMIQMSSATVDALHFDDLLDVYEVLEEREHRAHANQADSVEESSLASSQPLFACSDMDDDHQFITVRRNAIEVKGKGTMETHFLVGFNLEVEEHLLPPSEAVLERYHGKLAQLQEEAEARETFKRLSAGSLGHQQATVDGMPPSQPNESNVVALNEQQVAYAPSSVAHAPVQLMTVVVKSKLGHMQVDHVPSTSTVRQVVDSTFSAPMTLALLEKYSNTLAQAFDPAMPASSFLRAVNGCSTVFADCPIGVLPSEENTLLLEIQPNHMSRSKSGRGSLSQRVSGADVLAGGVLGGPPVNSPSKESVPYKENSRRSSKATRLSKDAGIIEGPPAAAHKQSSSSKRAPVQVVV